MGQRFIIIGGCREAVERVQRGLAEALGRFGYDPAACFAVRTAVEEAVGNAIHHGNGGDPGRRVTVEYAADAETVVIDVQDEGLGFDPRSVPDPTRPENLDIPAGRGIMLMRHYMSEVEFAVPGNRVRMRFDRKNPPGRAGGGD